MKHYLLLLSYIFLFSTGSAQKTADSFFSSLPGFENASIGFCVKDLSGNEISSINKSTTLTPASTLKVLTSATALEILGEKYSYPTTLAVNVNNPQQLIIRGYGDPTLGSEYTGRGTNDFLNDWITRIKKQIDIQQPIDILVVDDYFGYSGVSSKWLKEDLGNYFAAGAYGISIFDNSYRLYFNTTDTQSAPQIIRTQPEMPDLIFLNTLKMNTTNKDNGYINGGTFSNYRTLVGDIPAKRSSFSIKGDIPDPGLMLSKTLSVKLQEEGYSVRKLETSRSLYYDNMYNRFGAGNPEESIFYTYYSPSLKDIIRVVNERSNNHYSEHLIRTIGRAAGDKNVYTDALAEGIIQTSLFWNNKGINTNSLRMYDGCGLAPSDGISAEMLCDILVYMKTKSKYSDAFVESLPKAGKEGTVRNILKGSRLEGKVILKSGSIANVQCFAGYYIDGDKQYAFSIMVNNYNSPRNQVVKAIENILLKYLQ